MNKSSLGKLANSLAKLMDLKTFVFFSFFFKFDFFVRDSVPFIIYIFLISGNCKTFETKGNELMNFPFFFWQGPLTDQQYFIFIMSIRFVLLIPHFSNV